MRYSIFIILLCSLSACDLEYDVEYYVENKTGENITIISSTELESTDDTDEIGHNKIVRIGVDLGIGESTKSYLDNWTGPAPFIDNLLIFNNEGDTTTLDVFDREEWILPAYDRKTETGAVYLLVRPEDF